MRRREKVQAFLISLTTYKDTMKTESEYEEIGLKDDGTVIHNKYLERKLCFSHEAKAKDMEAVADFFDKIYNVYNLKKWKKVGYLKTSPMLLSSQIMRFHNNLYREWVIEFTENNRFYQIFGDTAPEHAEEISKLILDLYDFDPVPDIFFLKANEPRDEK